MESRHFVDDPPRCVSAYSDLPSVGGEGEDVGRPVECTHSNPTTVSTEADVLNLQGYVCIYTCIEGRFIECIYMYELTIRM